MRHKHQQAAAADHERDPGLVELVRHAGARIIDRDLPSLSRAPRPPPSSALSPSPLHQRQRASVRERSRFGVSASIDIRQGGSQSFHYNSQSQHELADDQSLTEWTDQLA